MTGSFQLETYLRLPASPQLLAIALPRETPMFGYIAFA